MVPWWRPAHQVGNSNDRRVPMEVNKCLPGSLALPAYRTRIHLGSACLDDDPHSADESGRPAEAQEMIDTDHDPTHLPRPRTS